MARALDRLGEAVIVAGRRPPPARGLPRSVRRVALADLAGSSPRRLLLAVADPALRAVAAGLARRLGPGRPGDVAWTTSGLRPLDDLAPLRRTGRSIGTWHPVAPFPAAGEPDWTGLNVAVGGDPAAVRIGRRLARRVGGRPFSLGNAGRGAYHLGLTCAAAGVVALLDAARERLVSSGVPADDAARVLASLATRAAGSWSRAGGGALTGSIARGDVAAVEEHLRSAPAASRPLVVELFRRVLALALREGTAPTPALRRIGALLPPPNRPAAGPSRR